MSTGMMMRSAMAMIELIFAIVIIAISVMTIPSMMNIAGESSKKIAIDDDVMARLSGQMIDKFQARWGGEYDINTTRVPITFISAIVTMPDLNCSRIVGAQAFRANPDSTTECNITQIPLEIPATTGVGLADGNISKGLEKLNSGTEILRVTSSTGESFNINATYNVRYVNSSAIQNTNTETATWRLGSSGAITEDNGGSLGAAVTDRTHLKRIVVRFWNTDLDVDTTLTFFKSNKGNN